MVSNLIIYRELVIVQRDFHLHKIYLSYILRCCHIVKKHLRNNLLNANKTLIKLPQILID